MDRRDYEHTFTQDWMKLNIAKVCQQMTAQDWIKFKMDGRSYEHTFAQDWMMLQMANVCEQTMALD